MGDKEMKPVRRRKRRSSSEWTLNDWLEFEWRIGVPRPTVARLAADCPFDELVYQPEPLYLSGDAVKALIYLKGWLLQDLASHWGMRPESLSRIINEKVERPPWFVDAVIGLPPRANWIELVRRGMVQHLLVQRVSLARLVPIQLLATKESWAFD